MKPLRMIDTFSGIGGFSYLLRLHAYRSQRLA